LKYGRAGLTSENAIMPRMPMYGPKEWLSAAPIAEALVASDTFRTWLISRTKFVEYARDARLLHEEMKLKRSRSAQTWWRSHFQEKCRCEGCCGQETDLLAIFESKDGFRFALHIEIKHSGDRFGSRRQAKSYPLRAQCWVKRAPSKVLAHNDASTVLICDGTKHFSFQDDARHFDTVLFFENLPTLDSRGAQ
jgi:hypothetical protein